MDDVGRERRAVFERIAREVVEPVRRYLARRTDAETAEDVLSETLIVLWRRLDEVPVDAVPWSIGIARWQLTNTHRSRRRADRLIGRILATDMPRPGVSEHADRTVEAAVMGRALGSLNSAEAELLRLWAWDDLEPARIAAVLGITPNAVTLRLRRARRSLAEALRQLGAVPGQEPEERGGHR